MTQATFTDHRGTVHRGRAIDPRRDPLPLEGRTPWDRVARAQQQRQRTQRTRAKISSLHVIGVVWLRAGAHPASGLDVQPLPEC